MTDDHSGFGDHTSESGDLIEIDLSFDSVRRFQTDFSSNISEDGIFIETDEPLSPGSVVRFRVVLPEEFVFLEGTSVVEWIRGADGASDGPPGMALRFVTLSSQNQELVCQLVQDYMETGGVPFDLDFRPMPVDFPTDALEGAQRPVVESADEGYRLTVRRTEPILEAEALRALHEVAEHVEEPPRLGELAAPDAEMDDSSVVESDGDGIDIDEPIESSFPNESFLTPPVDSEGEAEAMEDDSRELVGGPAFDINLPAAHQETEATPVFSDDQTDNVAVAPVDVEETPPRRRRLWPLALVAVVVLAVAAGFLWPNIQSWLAPREIPQANDTVSMVGEVAGGIGISEGEEAYKNQTGTAEPVVEVTAGEQGETPQQETDLGARGTAEEPADPQTESTLVSTTTEPARADTVTAIEVEPRAPGTVIRISANGGLGGGAISMESLESPPRVLVRLRGIKHDYRPYTIESSTTEVTRVRIGLHEDLRPPELWVVIDLTGPGTEIGGIDIQGDRVEFMISGR